MPEIVKFEIEAKIAGMLVSKMHLPRRFVGTKGQQHSLVGSRSGRAQCAETDFAV
jgi:hypothetical protein